MPNSEPVLDKRFDDTLDLLKTVKKYTDDERFIVNGIDTLMIRKTFENEVSPDKIFVLEYVEKKLCDKGEAYSLMKHFIDRSECSSDYFRCNFNEVGVQRRFIGATKNVVFRTFAGMMI